MQLSALTQRSAGVGRPNRSRLPVIVHASARLFAPANANSSGVNTYEPRRLQDIVVPSAVHAQAERQLHDTGKPVFQGVHHVALICANLEASLDFYVGVLGLQVNPDRPHDKLPYRGAWLWIGSEMVHLMELPNPDPASGRPEHGGRDRHFCVGVESVGSLADKLVLSGIAFTRSMSGRPAIFFRDPDGNCLECAELETWR